MVTEAPRFVIREVELYERPVKLRLPFRFGVITLTACPQAFARVRIARADGRSAWGVAAEMLAPKWFDKNLALSNDDNFNQLRDVLKRARAAYLSDNNPTSAFGHFARHYGAHLAAASKRGYNPLLANYGPALLDRAVLDALCRALGISFYAALRGNVPGIGVGCAAFAGHDFDSFLAGLRPAATIAARHTVGMADAITAAELKERVGDGLPETLEEVLQVYGHHYFKLKVSGDITADLARLGAIAAVLDRLPEPYFVTLDGNEQYPDARGVAALMTAMREGGGRGEGMPNRAPLRRLHDSILFIEQPIARSLALDVDLRDVTLGKPVIIDESDGELDSFVQARARGYAGVSSKTCKGIYKSILNAARCAAWNAGLATPQYFMSAEDLTTQAGVSVQQDMALANLLGIKHVERNGHHYVNGMSALSADEQQRFLDAHPDLYERSDGAVRLKIRDGRIALGSLDCAGYASAALPDFAGMQEMV